MTLSQLVDSATDKHQFNELEDYVVFARRYLEFIVNGLQATIVSQNETTYRFLQYREDGHYNVSRPLNSKLFYVAEIFDDEAVRFLDALDVLREGEIPAHENRSRLNRMIYTLQQCIGAALDALPAGRSNQARKINGDLFERLICLLVQRVGVDCIAGTVKVPIYDDSGVELCATRYQHDMLVRNDGELKIIGSVKTSSKDRIDKVFVDKFLYNKLTKTQVPHIAIFLNDVQRKATRSEGVYGINPTFLANHFKAYTLRLNALDGVYYCDIRPNMQSDPLLSSHISPIERFFFDDLSELCERGGQPVDDIEVEVDKDITP